MFGSLATAVALGGMRRGIARGLLWPQSGRAREFREYWLSEREINVLLKDSPAREQVNVANILQAHELLKVGDAGGHALLAIEIAKLVASSLKIYDQAIDKTFQTLAKSSTGSVLEVWAHLRDVLVAAEEMDRALMIVAPSRDVVRFLRRRYHRWAHWKGWLARLEDYANVRQAVKQVLGDVEQLLSGASDEIVVQLGSGAESGSGTPPVTERNARRFLLRLGELVNELGAEQITVAQEEGVLVIGGKIGERLAKEFGAGRIRIRADVTREFFNSIPPVPRSLREELLLALDKQIALLKATDDVINLEELKRVVQFFANLLGIDEGVKSKKDALAILQNVRKRVADGTLDPNQVAIAGILLLSSQAVAVGGLTLLSAWPDGNEAIATDIQKNLEDMARRGKDSTGFLSLTEYMYSEVPRNARLHLLKQVAKDVLPYFGHGGLALAGGLLLAWQNAMASVDRVPNVMGLAMALVAMTYGSVVLIAGVVRGVRNYITTYRKDLKESVKEMIYNIFPELGRFAPDDQPGDGNGWISDATRDRLTARVQGQQRVYEQISQLVQPDTGFNKPSVADVPVDAIIAPDNIAEENVRLPTDPGAGK